MYSKTMTILIGALFAGVIALPVAAAHWDGTTSPHEHYVVAGSSVGLTWYSGQRLCVNTVPDIPVVVYSDPQGNCPPNIDGVEEWTPVPPFRGITTGLGNCFDVDGLTHTDEDGLPDPFIDTTLKFNRDIETTHDYGTPVTYDPLLGYEPFADGFRWGNPPHPTDPGNAPNPTGATPLASVPTLGTDPTLPYPIDLTVAAADDVQLAINKVGLGALGDGTSTQFVPGPDVGDNDFEIGQGIACHTYAIDSGDTSTDTSGASTGDGGASLNDPLCIGLDKHFDVAGQSGLYGCPNDSPWIDEGDTWPETGAGFLLTPHQELGLPPIVGPLGYSLCVSLGSAGCTNIPDSTTGGVYSSLQDCVYIDEVNDAIEGGTYQSPGQAHTGTFNVYRGEQANWGTTTPSGLTNGGTHRSCFPERLAWSSNNVYLPESLVKDQGDANAAWNPDHLPATYSSIESVTVFVDLASTNTGSGTTFCPDDADATECIPDPEPESPPPTVGTVKVRSAAFPAAGNICVGRVTINTLAPLAAYTGPTTTITFAWQTPGCHTALPTININTDCVTLGHFGSATVGGPNYGPAPVGSVSYTVSTATPSKCQVTWVVVNAGTGIAVLPPAAGSYEQVSPP